MGDPGRVERTVRVQTLDTMRFDPETVEAAQGETLKFEVTNVGNLPHEFTLGDEAEQASHEEEMADPDMTSHDHSFSVWVDPGQTKEIVWKFTKPGEVIYGCHVPGHYDAGMKGVVEVG